MINFGGANLFYNNCYGKEIRNSQKCLNGEFVTDVGSLIAQHFSLVQTIHLCAFNSIFKFSIDLNNILINH